MLKEPFQLSTQSSVFEQIRSACASVLAQAEHVTIISDQEIAKYAASLPDHVEEQDVWDGDHHYRGTNPEALAAYVMILDAINFGGPVKENIAAEGFKLIDNSFYFAISTRLKQIFESDGALTAADLQNLDVNSVAQMFDLGTGPIGFRVASLFQESLKELGDYIAGEHDGKFINVIEASKRQADQFVRSIVAIPSFRDIHTYGGRVVPLLKRAQIAASDMHLAFGVIGQGVFEDSRHFTALPDTMAESLRGLLNDEAELFDDTRCMTAFADNAVAKVLSVDGPMRYSDVLQDKIARHIPLQSGSREEIELRCATIVLVDKIAQMKPGLSAINVDHVLWHRSHDDHYRHRSHIVITKDY